jgi:hypothetical protein
LAKNKQEKDLKIAITMLNFISKSLESKYNGTPTFLYKTAIY